MTRTTPLAWTSIGLAVTAQLLVAVLATAFAGQVDPLRDPVSDYVFHRGGRALFVVAVLLVITSGAALAAAARLAGLPVSAAVSVLFGLWLGGLVVVLVFRGNVSAGQPTLQGGIHRFGGAVLFTSLPLACRALARQLRSDPRWAVAARRLGWSALAGLTTAAAFGLAQYVPALPQGLLERLALAAELVILVTTALAVRRAER